jgi:hypothetical protein
LSTGFESEKMEGDLNPRWGKAVSRMTQIREHMQEFWVEM